MGWGLGGYRHCKSLRWKLTLGEKSLAAPGNRACFSDMPVRHSTHWATSPPYTRHGVMLTPYLMACPSHSHNLWRLTGLHSLCDSTVRVRSCCGDDVLAFWWVLTVKSKSTYIKYKFRISTWINNNTIPTHTHTHTLQHKKKSPTKISDWVWSYKLVSVDT